MFYYLAAVTKFSEEKGCDFEQIMPFTLEIVRISDSIQGDEQCSCSLTRMQMDRVVDDHIRITQAN